MTATAAQEPAIRVHGLTKSYSELEVLRGVDFEVARGSIFALLGSNGAGKTTVVKIVSTLLKADAGEATVNGFEVAGQAAEVRKFRSGREVVERHREVQEHLAGCDLRSVVVRGGLDGRAREISSPGSSPPTLRTSTRAASSLPLPVGRRTV